MKAELIESKQLLGKPLQVEEVKYRYEKFEGGMSEPVTKVVVQRDDAVAAIVYNADTGEYIFTNQFRYSVMGQATGWITEILAGVIDEGETAQQALERELEEELGYKANKLEKICSFYTTPGYSKEQVHLFYVEVSNYSKTTGGGGLADEQEDIQAICYSIDDIKAILFSNGFNDAKTMVACYYLLNKSMV